MENGHWVRWFTHKTWWIFPVRYVNVYQRVTQNIAQSFNVKSDGPSPLQVTERQETPGRGQSRPCRWENCWLGPWWTDGSDHMFTHGLGDVYGRCFFGHPMAHSPKCGATGAAMKACATSCDQELWMSHGKIGGTLKCYNVGPPSYKLVYKPH